MSGLPEWLKVVLLVFAVLFGLSVAAALLGAVLVRMGMRRPKVVAWASRLSERVLRLVKRPLTVVVLDEVAAVLATGHYTKNISASLAQNHDELKALVAEKVKQDPSVRLIGRLPGYDTIVSQVTETTLRVVTEMLDDPRTEELINDLIRNNLVQIRQAVRDRDHERGEEEPTPPTPSPPSRRPQ